MGFAAMIMSVETADRDVATPTKASLPPLRTLILSAVLLPTFVAVTNQGLFYSLRLFPSLRPLFYPWIVFTTAVLSWCIGRFLRPFWLSWIVFGWCLVLLDLLTIAACQNGVLPRDLAFTLMAAETGLLVSWTILADVDWRWRLPIACVAAPSIVIFARNWRYDHWATLVFLAAAVMAFICSGLRYSGFLLQRDGKESQFQSRASIQFGTKHMLIWAAAIAPLLLVARGADYLVFANLDRQSIFPAIVLSLTLAIVSLIAIWAVLGAGPLPIRVAILLFVPPVLAFGLNLFGAALRPPPGAPWNWGGAIRHLLWELESGWATWLWLDAALFAALLLFLRASGYQLARKRV
jgi:hypothetical protein